MPRTLDYERDTPIIDPALQEVEVTLEDNAVLNSGVVADNNGRSERRRHGRGTEAAAAEVVRIVRLGKKKGELGEGGEGDLLQLYLNEIGRHPLLTKDDEVKLYEAIARSKIAVERLSNEGLELTVTEIKALQEEIAKGDEARKVFINSNLRLVVAIAKKRSTLTNLLENIQLGNRGLMRAVEKFDGRKGFRFSTYATWWITNSIARGKKEGKLIQIPYNIQEQIRTYRRSEDRFRQDFGRNGTIDEIIAHAGLDAEKTKDALWFVFDPLSLNSDLHPDGDLELGDILPDKFIEQPEDSTVRMLVIDRIVEYLDVLSDDERTVTELHFGIGHERTYKSTEIAQVLKINRSLVLALLGRSLSKLRHPTSDLMLGEDEWRQDAECLGVDNRLFFPHRGEPVENAREVCNKCSVRGDCLSYSLEHKPEGGLEKDGIWGGTSERQRRSIRSPK